MQVVDFPDLGPDGIQKPVFTDDQSRFGIKLRLLGGGVPFDFIKALQGPEKIIRSLKAGISLGLLRCHGPGIGMAAPKAEFAFKIGLGMDQGGCDGLVPGAIAAPGHANLVAVGEPVEFSEQLPHEEIINGILVETVARQRNTFGCLRLLELELVADNGIKAQLVATLPQQIKHPESDFRQIILGVEGDGGLVEQITHLTSLIGGEGAALAVFEPFLADLVAADVEIPHTSHTTLKPVAMSKALAMPVQSWR